MEVQKIIIAHRGASYLAPENTVASVKLAWELGADAVEIDVHLTKDDKIMVIHDGDTKRTCSGRKNLKIAKSSSFLLRDLDAGIWKGEEFKGEKIPYLSEIIDTIPQGKTLVVEIKSSEVILDHLAYVLEKNGSNKNMVFIGFDRKTIVAAKKRFPEHKCYWLSESKSAVKRHITEISTIGLDGININNKIVDQKIMNLAKAANLDVLSWTIDNPAEAKRLIDLGVSGITTNRPEWLRNELTKL